MRYLFFLTVLMSILLSGCVQVSQDLSINSDGTGTLNFIYAVKEQDLQRMRDLAEKMAALDPDLAQEDVDWLTAFDEEVIRKEWNKSVNEGVYLNNVVTELKNGWRIMRAEIGFDALQRLFDCGMIEDCHIALTRGPGGQYGFQQSIDVAKMSESLPAGLDLNTLQPLMSMMFKDFRADIRFNAPGAIIRSNADNVEGQSASWSVRGDQPDFVARLQDFDVRLMFDGKGMQIADALMLK